MPLDRKLSHKLNEVLHFKFKLILPKLWVKQSYFLEKNQNKFFDTGIITDNLLMKKKHFICPSLVFAQLSQPSPLTDCGPQNVLIGL